MVHEMAEVMDSEAERINDFKGTLQDLKFNSKPLISMLTMLAESEKDYPSAAAGIVMAIEERLHEVRVKDKLSPLEIPILYLIDSIVKNVGGIYIKLFTQNIVSNFCRIFERSDEKVRSSLYKLRCTWKGFFPPEKLSALDRKVKQIDPKWPILPTTSSSPDTSSTSNGVSDGTSGTPSTLVHQVSLEIPPSSCLSESFGPFQVHINPNFIKNKGKVQPASDSKPSGVLKSVIAASTKSSGEKLQQKELERIEREKREMAERVAKAEREAELLRKQLAAQELERKKESKGARKRGRQQNNSNRQSSPGPSAPRRTRVPSPPPPPMTVSQMLTVMQPSGPLYTRRSEVLNESYQSHNGYTGPVWAANGPMGIDQNYRAGQEFIPPPLVPPPVSSQAPVAPAMVDPMSGQRQQAPVVQQASLAQNKPLINVTELVSRLLNNNNKNTVVPPVTNQLPLLGSNIAVPPTVESTLAPSLPLPHVTSTNQSPIVTPTTVLNPNIAAGSTTGPWSMQPKQPSPPRSSRGGVTGSKTSKQTNVQSTNEDCTIRPSGPEPPLSWSNLDSLKVNRPSLIASIYDGRQCTSCPLRFFNPGKDYQSHLDWHFRQNKRKKGRGATGVMRRNWYYSFDLWLLFKESSDEDDTTGSLLKDGEESNSNSNGSTGEMVLPTVRASEDDFSPRNFCKVCGDKFETFFDQEEDAWLLRNAVEKDTGNCHPSCLTDWLG